MLVEGVRLLPHDPYLGELIVRTLRLAAESTLVALILGLPLACAVGVGRSRRSGWGLMLANAGLGLPPVAVGVYFFLLLSGYGTPWGGAWLNTMNGMVLGQTVLALPIVVAIAAVAIRGLPDGLIDQARAFGASGWRLGLFALREARVGVLTAVILAFGSAIAEVGAVTLIGGNSENSTSTLASQVITDVEGAGGIPAAVEHVIVLMAMTLALGVAFTIAQHWGTGTSRRRARERDVAAEQDVASVGLAA